MIWMLASNICIMLCRTFLERNATLNIRQKRGENNMVFYFTATGNSLYVAKQLSDAPISIPQIMRGERRRFSDDVIGIVCPVYAGQPPQMVLRFLQKSELDAEYLYIILTYGHDQSDSPEFTAALAEKYGVHVDYIAAIKMVDNYLPVFDMSEETAVDKHVEEQIEVAALAVAGRTRDIPKATEEQRKLHAHVAELNRQTPDFNNGSQIAVLSACIGCGICEKVCPIGNFYIENGRAERKQNTCEFCLSCVQNCPQKAIGLSMADKNPKSRYRNTHISLQEIMAANGVWRRRTVCF